MTSLLPITYIALVLLAGLWDLARFTIPNAVPLVLVALFLAAGALTPGPVAWLSHIGAGLLAGLLATIAFASGKMGGGDVKFIAALGLWAGHSDLLALLVAIALAGGVLALALLALRWTVDRRGAGNRAGRTVPVLLRPGAPVPYGVAIAAGGLLVPPDLSALGAL